MTLEEIRLLPGWCPPAKEKYLLEYIREHKPMLIAEIGIYAGRSFIPMAFESAKYGGRTVGIDPWDRNACLEGMVEGENLKWWTNDRELNHVEGYCRKAISDLKLSNVELLKGRSDDFINSFQDNEIDLLSIDGNHGPQALIDGQNYLPKVKVGGLIACDDSLWRENDILTVKIMIDWLCSNGCRSLEVIDECDMLIKEY